MHPKKIFVYNTFIWDFEKKPNGWRFDFRGPKFFWLKGCRLVLCQVQNADLIAVSLACPKDPKNLLSEGSYLKKVVSEILRNGISRKLERHCSSGPIKLGIFDIYRSTLTQSNCLGWSASIFKWDFWSKNFFGCNGAVPYSQGAPKYL